MNKFLYFLFISFLFASCNLNNQAKQVNALEKCTYEITSADSVYVAGKNVSKLIQNNSIDINNMPELAIAYMRQNIPFKAKLNLQIKNPTQNKASINQFEYIVLLKDQELARGTVDQKVSVEPGETTRVPVNVKGNIYQILSNGKTMKDIVEFLKGTKAVGGPEKKGIVTLKIKPTIEVGNKLVAYPGFITINKEISSNMLF
ncbi:NDR1/HIN1-like protein [Daejeonella oryzae]|uniref:NDR1/HIN1-like protein n=1 Tax=Daejeonella oryzae TaxID=1122943 RepID=UPI0004194E29|nr:LEA type 2 family protein [Daejeonella oryzae]